MGRPGVGRLERLGPVRRAEPDVRPGGLDGHALGGRLLVQRDRRLDGLHHLGGRLQAGCHGVRLGNGCGALRNQVAQRARLDALLAQAGQDVRDVGEVALVRADEQDAAAVPGQPRVGVEQVRGPVQRDDGLPGAWAAVDDERAVGAGADDGVLVGLDGGEHVPHAGRAAAAQRRDERRVVVEGQLTGRRVRAQGLVPVVEIGRAHV